MIFQRENAKSPHEAIYFYNDRSLEAVRSDKWKLHFPHQYSSVSIFGMDGKRGEYIQAKTELALFDLEKDIGETTNVAAQHPDVVEKLKALAEKAREVLGDGDRKGKGVRPVGRHKI